MTEQEYKAMSIKEFTKAAEIYDSGHWRCENSQLRRSTGNVPNSRTGSEKA